MSKNFLFGSLLLLVILLVSAIPVHAITINLRENLNGDVLDTLQMNGDATLSNFFNEGFAGATRTYTGFLDYRLETTVKDRHLGGITSRVSGIGFFDDRVNTFMDDPVIDLPELFYKKDFQNKKKDGSGFFVFGKFANRRYFNKDEYSGDPQDIGERRFAGAQVNTLNIFSGINEFRDEDQRQYGTREATGSYGFAFGAKNKYNIDFRQAFAVARMNNFAGNFYGISELSKEFNAGTNHPSKIMAGYLYANDSVFRIPGSNKNSQLIYSMYTGKYKKLSYYARYGVLYGNSAGDNFTANEARLGTTYRFTPKDSVTLWGGYFDTPYLANQDHCLALTAVYKRIINQYTNLLFAYTARFNDNNALATNSKDNDMTFMGHLQFHF